MVQKREREPRQEQTIYSPYYYPNSSRYNYPAKIGGDEEQYTEQKFSFPHWDDEVQPYKPLRRRASTPFISAEYSDYFNKSLTLDSEDEDEEDGSETICDEIQNDIDLARKDQKSDYDQFRKAYATFHDDIRALQREIEAIEAACMKSGFDLKKCGTGTIGTTVNDDGTEIYYEPTCTVSDSSNNNDEGNHLLAYMPSATAAAAAARGMIAKKRSSPSILYRKRQQQQQNISGTFNDNNNNNSNNRRCLDIGIQERVHQNEGIRC